MAKNITVHSRVNVTLALPVPANTPAGVPVLLGTDGLKGFTLTPRTSAATLAAGTSPQGLLEGEASVELQSIFTVARLALTTAVTQFGAVYMTGAGAFTNVASGNTKIGYARKTIAAPGTVEVLLCA